MESQVPRYGYILLPRDTFLAKRRKILIIPALPMNKNINKTVSSGFLSKLLLILLISEGPDPLNKISINSCMFK